MTKIKVKCECGRSIEVNPASELAKLKKKPTSEQMKAIRAKRKNYPKKYKTP